MTHWTPVEDSPSSRWMFGIAMDTMVWSMNVIETAKIMAARTQLRPCKRLADMAASRPLTSRGRGNPNGRVPAGAGPRAWLVLASPRLRAGSGVEGVPVDVGRPRLEAHAHVEAVGCLTVRSRRQVDGAGAGGGRPVERGLHQLRGHALAARRVVNDHVFDPGPH